MVAAAWMAVGLLALTAWSAAFLPTPFFVAGVVVTLFAHWRLYRLVDDSPALSEDDREKVKSWLRWFGPLGAIQLLLYLPRR